MKRNVLCTRMLVVLLFAFFLSMNVITIQGHISDSRKSFKTESCLDVIIISGTMGNNGWYTSSVQITFCPPGGFTNHTFYQINNGSWTEYSIPLVFDVDGYYWVSCYFTDMAGNQSEIYSVSFKIDKTPPFVNITFHREGCSVLVSVDGFDNMSGIVGVEFYSDGALIGNVTTPPYAIELPLGLFGERTIEVIVYDAAGNRAEASHTFPYDCVLSFPHQKSIFHLQYALTVSWDGTPTGTPILNGETRKINFTIGYSVTRGAYGKFLLRLLEGRLFTIQMSVENTPDWCEAWFTLVNITGTVLYDESRYVNTSLFIHVNDDAPGNDTQGWVRASASIDSMKGPFHLLTLIHGFKQDFTITFLNGS